MTLADLMNNHYTRGVREAMLDLILGRSDNIVEVGDVVEMLLSISQSKMQCLTGNGLEKRERVRGKRIEHLSFVATWMHLPHHVLYSALLCLQDWHGVQSAATQEIVAVHDAWEYGWPLHQRSQQDVSQLIIVSALS